MTRLPRGAAQLKWRRQRQEKARRRPTLNLVALMDVFTILVFFFLVHSTDSPGQADSRLLDLPESVAEQQPRDAPVVTITRNEILLEGEPIATVSSAMGASRDSMAALLVALQNQSVPARQAHLKESASLELNIMGDRAVPFELLNKVMHTCTQAGYGNISLLVLQRSSGAG